MKSRYKQRTFLDPYSQHQFDHVLQEYIEAHPLQPVPAELIAAAPKLLSFERCSDISHKAGKLGRFMALLPKCITGCPVYTLEQHDTGFHFRHDLTYVDHMSSGQMNALATPDQLALPFQCAGYNAAHAVIGYDTEFVTVEREITDDMRSGEITESIQMVSHQIYLSLGIEHICVVIVTDLRFTQNAFVRHLLANAIPDSMVVYKSKIKTGKLVVRKVPITKVYLVAHFSLIEGGLLIPSYDKIEKIGADGEPYSFERMIIPVSEKTWGGDTVLRHRRNFTPQTLLGRKFVDDVDVDNRMQPRKRSRASSKRPAGLPVKSSVRFRSGTIAKGKTIKICFADSIAVSPGSLAKAGDETGIPKIDNDSISKMDELWLEYPRRFVEYAARDAIITAQTFLFRYRLLSPFVGGQIATRMAKYAENHFKIVLQGIYTKIATGAPQQISDRTGLPMRVPKAVWKPFLGQHLKMFPAGNKRLTVQGFIKSMFKEELDHYPETFEEYAAYLLARETALPGALQLNTVSTLAAFYEGKYQAELSKTINLLVPTPGVISFLPFYYGGRVESRVVGVYGPAIYWDLRSAFPTALLMMLCDYDFQRCMTTTGAACMGRIAVLVKDGPFQAVGVYCSWRVKDGFEPIFPVKAEGRRYQGEKTETMIFPMCGSGHIMWPVFFVAYTQGMLDELIVHSIVEFERLDSHELSDHMGRLMELRRDDPYNIIKPIISMSYGKTAQNVANLREDPNDVEGMSAVSCPPLAALMTAVCLAVIGELINCNDWYFIATDAVVIAGHDLIKTGPVTDMIQKKLDEFGYKFVQRDFIADQGLFLRSQGEFMVGRRVKDDVPIAVPTAKMAAMGMKVDKAPDLLEPGRMGARQVHDFMIGLITGELRSINFQSFSDLDDQYRDQETRRKDLQVKLKLNRNGQSRLRISVGISTEHLRTIFSKQAAGFGESFADFEHECVTNFIATGSLKANTLQQLIEDHRKLHDEYEAVINRQIFPRKYLRTTSVNTTYDFKRVPLVETIEPETTIFSYGPSDDPTTNNYTFEHVRFQTRPLYSADEYRQLILAAKPRMTSQEYIDMLEDLKNHGVLSGNQKPSNSFRTNDTVTSDAKHVVSFNLPLLEK